MKCQFEITHGSSVNNEYTLTPQDKLQLTSENYSQVQRNSCTRILQQHKNKLTVKTKQYSRRQEDADLG